MPSFSGDLEVRVNFQISTERRQNQYQKPGPRTKTSNTFSVYHWNLNSISVHKYWKVSLLKSYLTIHKFGVYLLKAYLTIHKFGLCLSETYLDSNTAHGNDNLVISGNNLLRSDRPSNSTRGGVCIYHKNFLNQIVLDIQYRHECIDIELKIGDKLCYIIALYRSPSQSKMNLKNFLRNLN